VTIDLTFCERDFFVAIVPEPTGVFYENQVAGTCCASPRLEGFLIPLSESQLPGVQRANPLFDLYCHGPEEARVREFLELTRTGHIFQPIPDDEPFTISPEDMWTGSNLYCGEAWVPVIVRSDAPAPFNAVSGRIVVLTHQNSD